LKLWSIIEKLASEPLVAQDIEELQGFHYIKGHVAIVHANEVFGLGNWSCDVDKLWSREVHDGKHLVSARVCVRVVGVCDNSGAPREVSFTDVGCCTVNKYNTDKAWDTAEKGAVTDGMKRALRNFGSQFGLGLYFGEGDFALPEPEEKRASKREARPEFAAIQMVAQMAKTHEELDKAYRDNKAEIKKLPQDWTPHINRIFAEARERLNKEVGPKA